MSLHNLEADHTCDEDPISTKMIHTKILEFIFKKKFRWSGSGKWRFSNDNFYGRKRFMKPHGGKLIYRVLAGAKRNQYLMNIDSFKTLTLDAWALSDLELIATGGFSPLTGFMHENDYNQVLETMRLEDGTLWSIPVTLAVAELQAGEFSIGDDIALVGEDGTVYGILQLEEKYAYDKEKEAYYVYGTTDIAHPGVKKYMKKEEYILPGLFIY